jgi:acetyl esterase/lipase
MAPDTIQPDDVVIFKTIGEVDLKLHVFNPPGHGVATPRPAIVFFFGGGWQGGSPTQFYPHCAYFASRGMVAMAAEYRTHSQHGTSPYECVADAKSALRWIRQNAAALGIEANRVAAGGGSAGGHLAAAAALVTSFDDPADDLTASCRPAALVLFNPAFDNGPGGCGHPRVADRWQEFSPAHNIAPGAPPTIVFLGSQDTAIPVATAENYKQKMAVVYARCDVWIYEGQAHGFFNYRDGDNPYYHATVLEADRFLAGLGYIEGVATVEQRPVEARLL